MPSLRVMITALPTTALVPGGLAGGQGCPTLQKFITCQDSPKPRRCGSVWTKLSCVATPNGQRGEPLVFEWSIARNYPRS